MWNGGKRGKEGKGGKREGREGRKGGREGLEAETELTINGLVREGRDDLLAFEGMIPSLPSLPFFSPFLPMHTFL